MVLDIVYDVDIIIIMKFILIFLLFFLGCRNDQSIKKNLVDEVWHSNIEMGSYLCSHVLEDKYFFAIHNNTLKSINFENGNGVLWSQTFSNGVEHAPVLYGDNLYLADLSGDIFCINATNGTNIWNRSLNTQIISLLNIEDLDGKELLLVPAYDNKLHAFDSKTGETIWEFSTDNFLNAQPAISEDRKYLVFGNCGGTLFIINDSGTLYKTLDLNSPLASSPVIIDEKIYIGSHSDGIFCVSLKTGQILNRYFEKEDINFMSSPVSNGDMVYFVGSDNNIYAINGKTLQISKFFTANSEINSNLLFINDYIFISESSGMMYLINNLKDVAWQTDNGTEILSTLKHKNYIVIGDSQGIIMKIRVK